MENVSLKFGPIDPYLKDPTVSEIMVNRFDRIFLEREGKLTQSPAKFPNEAALTELVLAIAKQGGRELGPQHPFMDSYLPDGSRVNVTLPPMAPGGATLTIRKFRKEPYSLQDYIRSGFLSDKAAYFIHACVIGRLNLVISGGTGTGKTTFLNTLSGLIPASERIITIEDVAELSLQHPNWVRLEAVAGIGNQNISTRDCIMNALRMRPDRIIVGECRKDETFEMLQSMNTGHDGSMTTVHANTSRDCLSRIESLIFTSDVEIPLTALRKQMVSAIQIIVQLKRGKGGVRYVQEIVEITGMEQNTITMQTLFSREKKKVASGQPIDIESLVTTGMASTLSNRFLEAGVQLPPNFFDPNTKITYQPD